MRALAKKFLIPTLLVLALSCQFTAIRTFADDQPAAAAPAAKTDSAAKAYIDNMGRRAIEFLGDAKLTQTQKKDQFRKLLEDSFDMATIGRFALGSYWRSASPAQQAEYQSLFREMIVQVYSQRFEDYKGQKFQTTATRRDGDKDTIVSSLIIPDDGDSPDVNVDWRVRNKGGRYQIVDVIVEGVSMSVTQRSDFSSVIQRGGGNVSVLIDYLRKK